MTWFKKIVYYLTNQYGHQTPSQLSENDVTEFHTMLRPGDVILLTDYRDIAYKYVYQKLGDLFTHAALYQGNNQIIHANSLGVHEDTLQYVCQMFDAYVILRPTTKGYEKRAIAYARSQLGLPYDFTFKGDTKHSFCTELVNEAYKCAGYKTRLSSIHKYTAKHKKAFSWVIGYTALRPDEMLKGNFETVHHSQNIMRVGSKFKRKL